MATIFVLERLWHVALTMRRASPSAMAVLPTPGSPMRTDCFCAAGQDLHHAGIRRRGRSPDRSFRAGEGGEVRPYFSSAETCPRVRVGDALVATQFARLGAPGRASGRRLESFFERRPPCSSSRQEMSVLTKSSLSLLASPGRIQDFFRCGLRKVSAELAPEPWRRLVSFRVGASGRGRRSLEQWLDQTSSVPTAEHQMFAVDPWCENFCARTCAACTASWP